jgi:perosamine synthetase
MTNKRLIPYGRQTVSKGDISAVVKTLKSAWLTQGPKASEFEREIASYCGAKYVVAVSSGTAALHLACLAAGIKRKDTVITSPLTFAASANCVLYAGGLPLFADIEKDTGNLDSEAIKNIIAKMRAQQLKNLRAIIPVHYAGHPCNMQEIGKIARRHGLFVIEDACHALGAEYSSIKNKRRIWHKVGSCEDSDMAVFSFHPVKSITTGEGGAVTTNDPNLYKRLIRLRNHGIAKTKDLLLNKKLSRYNWYYEMQLLGFNYRMTDIQASLGISQMKNLKKFILKRRRIAKLYLKKLAGSGIFDLPTHKENAKSSFHLFHLRVKEKYIGKKQILLNHLRDKGIGTQVHYIPVYSHPYYRRLGYKPGLCPIAENFFNRVFSIPIYPGLRNSELNLIIKILKEARL